MTPQDLARPLALCLALALPALVAAQPEPAPRPEVSAAEVSDAVEPPPHLVRLEGTGAQVVRDGASLHLELGDPILFGDRLDIGEAYGQVLWGDGTRVAMDRGARLEALGVDLLAITAGRVLIARPAAATTALRVDTPAASFVLPPGGEYRFSLDGEVTTLAVVRGRADVQTGMGDQAVDAGQQVTVRDGVAPDAPRRFNSAGYDSFVAWATAPLAAPAAGAPLETFQDPRFEAYADVFNQYGSWGNDAEAGSVWYPTVSADWRPYGDGYWQAYGPQSQWLWVGRDPWGWPTHHFGRWGMGNRGRWYWKPGHQFAPSWVSWSVGPGYIGWTPLGYQDRPQWGWDTLTPRRGVYPGGTLDPSRAWTVVPSDRFGQRDRMGAYAVDPRTLDNLSAFVSQRVGPPARYGVVGGAGYGPGLAPFGGPGGTAVYGPGGYSGGVRSRTGGDTTGDPRRGIGPTRVGPPAPGYGGYGGPTPPAEDPYERAQRAVAPRSRQRAPQAADTPGASTADPPPQRAPSRAVPAPSPAPPSRRDTAPPPPAAEPAAPPPARETAPPPSSGRASGSSTGRRAVPRP